MERGRQTPYEVRILKEKTMRRWRVNINDEYELPEDRVAELIAKRRAIRGAKVKRPVAATS